MAINNLHAMCKSGMAALSDLDSEETLEIISALEHEQEKFLSNENKFRSADYPWPHDALHTWSRYWEYPYVYFHLKEHFATHGTVPEVVDLGSGVTFFPFVVAKLGCHVRCLDIDDTYARDIELAAKHIPHSPGKVVFDLISNERFPANDGIIDAVYCISVLEHITDFETTIKEVDRVLMPNGLFILTIDMDMCGYLQIGSDRFYDLRKCLLKYFNFKAPEFTVHPMDLLRSQNAPFPYIISSKYEKFVFYIKQRIKAMLGKKAYDTLPNLAIWGAVLIKK